jgi:lipopolysaccharide/colanic/teichoic acid biosynthesis glycosyltransferase
MSVVGPRPHLWLQNKVYGNKINKYMKRHFVKPGVTGLAQVSGYRGEIEKDADMINRVKLDILYRKLVLILDLKLFIKLWLISIKEKIKPISMESALVSIIIPTFHNLLKDSFCASTILWCLGKLW